MKHFLTTTAAIALMATSAFAMHHEAGGKSCKSDLDGDGKVTKEEFLKHAEEKFAKKDTNGDGVIDMDEHKAWKEKKKEKMKDKMKEKMKGKMKEHMKEKATEAAE